MYVFDMTPKNDNNVLFSFIAYDRKSKKQLEKLCRSKFKQFKLILSDKKVEFK